MIDLHTVATANGYKVSIMLEELALPYRVTSYDLVKGENFAPAFLALNPVGRLPAIVDHEVEFDGSPLSVYGSLAILMYLAEKSGKLLPQSGAARAKIIEWLGIIASDVGPAYSGQFVFNVIAPEKQPWAINFYNKLCLRLLQPIEQQLSRSRYLAGEDYSIADIIAYPVAAVSARRFPGTLDAHPQMARWAAELETRPAVRRGMQIPA
ncbi:MAG TPA: glutathione S-transferase N-terminal domain-containing protein [Steroidobacteraceae bacterium]|nr:glutathione S-transferase N-terminal domain-containing protein [Steroidobacteraceae bacterium]HRX89186.1 glutathione S-transferase N-terminal domain-containing protein [Steroidobacteraceae bacterium]